jgi:hypothetical protein
MRLIDANALVLTDMEIIMCNGNYKEALKMLIEKIDHAQPEIIMCKDCIHSPAAHDDCPLPVQYVVPEGFCHLGREKDEQGEV